MRLDAGAEPPGLSCRYHGFSPELFACYQRSEQALILTLMEVVTNGTSTRTVVHITEALCSRDTPVDDSLLLLYQPANLATVVFRIRAKPQRVVWADAHGGRIEVARQRELAYGASYCDPPDVVQELRVP